MSLETNRPFTRAQALAAGIDPGSPRFKRLLPAVYVGKDVPVTPILRAVAALLHFPATAFASHASAARVCGIPLPVVPEEHVSVLTPADRRRPRGVVSHLNPRPAVRVVREAAAYARERVDSPMETRLRMLLVLAGLPEPAVNLTIRDVDGTPVRRYDLCWPSVRVIVEYDGRHHIEREVSWKADLDRREAIDDEDWRILVVTARGVYREPERTVLRVW